MSKEELAAHGSKYSKSFNYSSSLWQTDFDAMTKKPCSILISRFASLSITMEKALTANQTGENGRYIDATPKYKLTTIEAKVITQNEPEEEIKTVPKKISFDAL